MFTHRVKVFSPLELEPKGKSKRATDNDMLTFLNQKRTRDDQHIFLSGKIQNVEIKTLFES